MDRCFDKVRLLLSGFGEGGTQAPKSKALQDFDWILALRNKHIVHDENSYYAFAWLEQDGDVRQVASMTYVTQIDPTLAAMMSNLVGLAQDYISDCNCGCWKGATRRSAGNDPRSAHSFTEIDPRRLANRPLR